MPPGVRSRLFLGIDQVQLAWRSILRERSAGASDGCFLASTHWRLDDARLAVRRGLSRVCVCGGASGAGSELTVSLLPLVRIEGRRGDVRGRGLGSRSRDCEDRGSSEARPGDQRIRESRREVAALVRGSPRPARRPSGHAGSAGSEPSTTRRTEAPARTGRRGGGGIASSVRSRGSAETGTATARGWACRSTGRSASPQPIRRRLRLARRLETFAPGTSLIPEHEEDR